MITLHDVPADALNRLAGLRLGDGPEYASPGDRMILDTTPGISFHEIRADGQLIGAFKLDPHYHERHDFAGPDDIGLRGVLIDVDHRGKGFGAQAMAALPALARARFPTATGLVLTVNVKNPQARAAYLKAGFADDGEIYHGGALGPQHIMRLVLR